MMRVGMPCSGSDVHDLAAICSGLRRLGTQIKQVIDYHPIRNLPSMLSLVLQERILGIAQRSLFRVPQQCIMADA